MIPSNVLSELKDLYSKVFDQDGNVTNCGRDLCEKLITLAQSYTDLEIGDPETGMINVENMKTFFQNVSWSALVYSFVHYDFCDAHFLFKNLIFLKKYLNLLFYICLLF